MDIQKLRQSLQDKWLSYYEENRQWLVRLGVWVNCEGQRRPSSSFILATLTVLEPQLTQLLPLIVDLSSNPDRIVMALGLNFNPDEKLAESSQAKVVKANQNAMKMLPAGIQKFNGSKFQRVANPYSQLDESCHGSKRDRRD